MTKHQKTELLRIEIAAALVLGLHFVPAEGWLRPALYLIPYLLVGAEVLQRAARGVWQRQPFDENLLMAVATVGAMVLGKYSEGVAVLLFYRLGEVFEEYAVGRSRRNISELMDIRPDYANLETADGLQRVAPEAVAAGDTIVVKPGERVPLDATVLEGTSALNMAALTGESVPRDVQPGDAVVSGSVNLSGALRLRADRPYGESTVARILELVENSSLKKAKTEKFISKFARYYTPAVCGAALVLALLPPLVRLALGMGAMWSVWIYRALTFLVISCPCALVISIPLSFFGGLGGASRRGILIKGSSYLEALARTDRVVFDKTGTLTRGTFEVTQIRPADGLDERTLLQLAAAVERFSDHPVSQSLRCAAGELPAELSITDAQELAGHGVTAVVAGQPVAAGNERLMQRLGLEAPACDEVGTVVHVACAGRYAGCIVIADQPKPGSARAIEKLKALGVTRVVMLTGDRTQAAEVAARELGVDETFSELLPGDKVEQVEHLLTQGRPGGRLAFVGDGINDAPVLARADLGVAMGGIGSDAAIEAADVVLMDDDPEKLPLAMGIARRTMRLVWQNIVFALAVKAACLILGALGAAGMWAAIFADVGVMVLCVLNATRALYTKNL